MRLGDDASSPVGDLYAGLFAPRVSGAPLVGPLLNEPAPEHAQNCCLELHEIDDLVAPRGQNGDALRTLCAIAAGDECTLDYGGVRREIREQMGILVALAASGAKWGERAMPRNPAKVACTVCIHAASVLAASYAMKVIFDADGAICCNAEGSSSTQALRLKRVADETAPRS